MIRTLAALSRRVGGGFVLVLLLGVVAGGVASAPVSAQDAGAIARQASAQLRTAERSMFAGKFDEAKQQLAAASELIDQVKAADPNLAQIATLERKRDKLAADLARRARVPIDRMLELSR